MKRMLLAASLCATFAAAQTTQPVVAAAQPQPAATTAKENPVIVVIETSLGTITAELNTEKAPISVSNFLAYADEKFFDGTIFHRVIPGFMIQGGGFNPQMSQKPTKSPVKNEAANGLKNDRGTLAMARTMVVDSATSQFFINLKDNAFLNNQGKNPQTYGYAVFGKVIEGLDVVDKIAAVETANAGPHQNVPLKPVEIKSIRRKVAAPVK